jgi:hypothetical protein
MEDLAIIVSLMLFVPIAVGILAIVLSILQRKRPQLRMFAILVTAVVGTTALLGLIQYVPLGIAPAIETAIASMYLFIRSRKVVTIIGFVLLGLLCLAILLAIFQQLFPNIIVLVNP